MPRDFLMEEPQQVQSPRDYLSEQTIYKPQTVKTFLGEMQPPTMETFKDPRIIQELIGAAAGTPGIQQAENLFANNVLSKNIAENIVKAKNLAKEKYSNLYSNLWKDTDKAGLNKIKLEPEKINIDAIKNYAPDKYTAKLEEFIKNPNHELAHKAQSDLGKYIEKNSSRSSIPSTEQDSIREAKKAKDYIQSKMFKNEDNTLNAELKQRYDTIQKGYPKEALPYTENKYIKKYEKGKLLPHALIKKLSSEESEFRALRGGEHPEFKRKDLAKHIAAALGVAGGTTYLGKTIYDYLSK